MSSAPSTDPRVTAEGQAFETLLEKWLADPKVNPTPVTRTSGAYYSQFFDAVCHVLNRQLRNRRGEVPFETAKVIQSWLAYRGVAVRLYMGGIDTPLVEQAARLMYVDKFVEPHNCGPYDPYVTLSWESPARGTPERCVTRLHDFKRTCSNKYRAGSDEWVPRPAHPRRPSGGDGGGGGGMGVDDFIRLLPRAPAPDAVEEFIRHLPSAPKASASAASRKSAVAVALPSFP